MPQGVIFDIDGTLIDSVDAHAKAWQLTLASFGHTVAFDAIRSQIGKGGDQLMPVFLPPAIIDRDGERIEQARSALFQTGFLPNLHAFPQVRALFQRAAAEGLTIALASSAKGEELETYKRMAGIEDLVDTETSSDDAERSKPHPDIFAAALDRMNLPARQVVVVGDSPYDAQAAGKLGLRTIGLLCGGFAEADLRAAGCQEIHADPADLLRHFGDSALARP